MTSSLKAEFKKLLTVRSTYIISFIALAIIAFMSFYVQGYKTSPTAIPNSSQVYLAGTLPQLAGFISAFIILVGILLMGHEYRYNTLVYTLTASNSRSKVLAAKLLAVMTYVFVITLLCVAIALPLMIAGVHLSGKILPHQDISWLAYFGKTLFYCEGLALAALLFAVLIRNMIVAIVAMYVLPGTIENLLGLLFRDHQYYLPFTALSQVIAPPVVALDPQQKVINLVTAQKGALIFLAYIVIAWAITWYLFLRRDAN